MAAGTAAYRSEKYLRLAKNNGGIGSLYRSQHEFVFVFKSATAPHVNNVELGKHGRYRTDIWSDAGVNGFGEDRADLNLLPIALIPEPSQRPVFGARARIYWRPLYRIL